MGNECVACDAGEIVWNQKDASYECNTCDFEFPYAAEMDSSEFFTIAKVKLGSRFDKHDSNKEFWDKLRALHNIISSTEEWKRKKSNFEKRVNENTPYILNWWSKHSKGLVDSEKAELVLDVAKERGLSEKLVCEVLVRSDEWNRATLAVYSHKLAKKHGKRILSMWGQGKGNEKVLNGEQMEVLHLVERISEKLELNEYWVASILKETGTWNGSSWLLWTFDKLDEYGEHISRLWENRKDKVKDDWTLCEVIESLSRDTGSNVKPSVIANILAYTSRIEIDSRLAYTTYVYYKYAKKGLESILSEGPATAKDLARRFGIAERNAHQALNLLHKRGEVKRYKGFYGANIHYVEGQEEQLAQISTYFKLERELLSRDHLSIKDVQDAGDLPKTVANELVKRWVKESKLVELDDLYPYLYVPNGEDDYTAIKNALADRLSRFLKSIGPEGIKKSTLKSRNNTSLKYVNTVLRYFEEYGLVYEKDGKYYSLTDEEE